MKAKHTPGPWRTIGPQDDEFEGAVVLRADGHLVADCNIFGGVLPIMEKECHANARLIASAPDLLDALEQLIHVSDEGDGVAYEDAVAAIAKAKGE